MEYFRPIEGKVLLRCNGAFSEHQIYADGQNVLYARKGNSYYRLMDHAATSKANMFWDDLWIAGSNKGYEVGQMGRLVLSTLKKKAA